MLFKEKYITKKQIVDIEIIMVNMYMLTYSEGIILASSNITDHNGLNTLPNVLGPEEVLKDHIDKYPSPFL